MSLDEDLETLKAQRDLLFGGLRKLATSDSTPDSIRIYLNSLGRKVVALKSKTSIAESNKPFSVGDTVLTTNNSYCRYKIEKIYEENKQMFCSLRTVWVKDQMAPAEGLHHNIPLNLLKHYKGA